MLGHRQDERALVRRKAFEESVELDPAQVGCSCKEAALQLSA